MKIPKIIWIIYDYESSGKYTFYTYQRAWAFYYRWLGNKTQYTKPIKYDKKT